MSTFFMRLFYNFIVSDLREEICYMQFDKGRCLKPFDGLYRKMLCCCSLGRAWGSNCEPCPRPGTGTGPQVDITVDSVI